LGLALNIFCNLRKWWRKVEKKIEKYISANFVKACGIFTKLSKKYSPLSGVCTVAQIALS
jgi:hypothetical protein